MSTPTTTPTTPTPTPTTGTDLSMGKATSSSSVESSARPASAAADGSAGSRWASTESDGQWWQVDLGASRSLGSVEVSWEAAYASRYQIQTSNDGTTWTTVATVTQTSTGVQKTALGGVNARYVRILGVTCGTPWGISIWEVTVRS